MSPNSLPQTRQGALLSLSEVRTGISPEHTWHRFDSLESVRDYVALEAAVVTTYREAVGGSERIEEHAWRTTANLYAFANGRIDRVTYRAAMLHDVAQKVSDPVGGVEAAKILAAYREELVAREDPDVDKIFWVLADLDEVENISEYARFDEIDNDEYRSVLQSNEEVQVPDGLWSEPVKIVSSRHLEHLEHTVVPQAIMIKTVEMLDNLTHRPPSDRALIQDIYDALSFFAPWCSAKGYDALETALLNAAQSWQMKKGGYGHELQKSALHRAQLGPDDFILKTARHILKELVGVDAHYKKVVPDDAPNHGTLFGVARFTHPALDPDVTIKSTMRRKSDVSATKAALEFPEFGRDFPDLDGMILIVPGKRNTYKVFANLVKTFRVALQDGEMGDMKIEVAPSPKRNHAIQVSGKDYAKWIEKGLRTHTEMSEDEIQKEVDSGPHYKIKAGKIAFMTTVRDPDGMKRRRPFELIVMSRGGRRNYRYGNGSHIAYKNEGEIRPQDLAAMNENRHALRTVSATVATRHRAAKLAELIDKAQ